MSTILSGVIGDFSAASELLDEGFGFKSLADFFGGSADLGKGLVYMAERVMETLNIK
ncbi:PorACj family cell wall channel-forming small protein [Corynebacterium ulceribovis]|uniref:PorACj family cell wall channel-forming small protein n=1 Tax=Corynebacterium ulceribovis TaxID=487732 RepID=UPI000360EE55|nr:PorACj family cell wall channel-forming small protein [Corynebacterium ulceribovis]